MNRIPPVQYVYRIDERTFDDISTSGGLEPKKEDQEGEPLIRNDNLTQYFEGRTPEGHYSAFVGTSTDFSTVMRHVFRSYVDPDPDPDPPYEPHQRWTISCIRASSNFYDVDASFNQALLNATQQNDEARIEIINDIYQDSLLDMQEYVAIDRIPIDRIETYLEINGQTIINEMRANGIRNIVNPSFWENQWQYNPAFSNDNGESNPAPYPNIATPTGNIRGFIDRQNQSEEPLNGAQLSRLSFGCLDFDSNSSSRVASTCDKPSKRSSLITYRVTNLNCYIRCATEREYVVGLSKNENGANIWLHNDLDEISQKWKFVYDKSKQAYRIISSQNTDLCLNYNPDSELQVIAWNIGNWDNQFWRVEEIQRSGHYTIRSIYNNNKVLALDSKKPSDKLNVVVADFDINNPLQKWEINSRKIALIPDGEYYIRNEMNENLVVELAQNINGSQLWLYEHKRNTSLQRWNFKYNKDRKAYKIVCAQNSDLCLSHVSDNLIIAGVCGENNFQYWRLKETESGGFYILSMKNTINVLSLSKGNLYTNGTTIETGIMNNIHPLKKHIWHIEPTDKGILAQGKYKIASKSNFKKVLDYKVINESEWECRCVILGPVSFTRSQEWDIKYIPQQQAYQIKNISNNTCLYSRNLYGPNLELLPSQDDDDKGLWKIEFNQSLGGYILRNLHSANRIVSIHSDTTGDHIYLDGSRNTPAIEQIWEFIPLN